MQTERQSKFHTGYLRKFTTLEKLWMRIERRGEDECWPWKSYSHPNGYGSFFDNGVRRPAHRWLWIELFGEPEDGLWVCHRCDNPICCNPNHLFLGTPKDNAIDCVNKLRRPMGSKQWLAKLTDDQVLEIKRKLKTYGPRSNSRIAREYGVGHELISRIKLGKTWKHIQ